MPTPVKDLTGLTFGGYVVTEKCDGIRSKQTFYKCVCRCGKETTLNRGSILANKTGCKDCSSLAKRGFSQFGEKVSYKRGKNPLYQLWLNIKRRILNPSYPRFKDYGGRGLKIEEKWVNSFDNFEKYILYSIGPKPGKGFSLDRVNNDLGYLEGNLKWSTVSEQNKNQRKKIKKRQVSHGGVLLSLEELSLLLDKNLQTIARCYHTKGMRVSFEYFNHFKIPVMCNYD